MMIIRSAPPSPFGRKVKIAASVAGLLPVLTFVDADTGNESDSLRRENPLGKIPTLILEDGRAIYDSHVIVDYFDHLGGAGCLIPVEPDARFRTLTAQALCDGIMDAALLIVYESRWRDEGLRSARWTDHQQGKVARGLAAIEAAPPVGTIDVGHIALACALGYLDLRFAGTWRALHPGLRAWLDAFEAHMPIFAKSGMTPA